MDLNCILVFIIILLSVLLLRYIKKCNKLSETIYAVSLTPFKN